MTPLQKVLTIEVTSTDALNRERTPKRYVVGCGLSCQATHGKQTLVCPTCDRFIWHIQCLNDRLKKRGMKEDLDSDAWKCPQCSPR